METWPNIERIALVLLAALVGWIAVMAGVMRLSDAAPAAVVPFPDAAFLSALPDNAAILDISPRAVTFANRTDLTAALYKAGALIVLPAGRKGCVFFRKGPEAT